jgi:hypothetical protein
VVLLHAFAFAKKAAGLCNLVDQQQWHLPLSSKRAAVSLENRGGSPEAANMVEATITSPW